MDQPTLRSLLQRPDLALRLVSAENTLPAETLDRPLRWVHSSDLADPTPFLAEDLALLTTGTQFADGLDAAGYVARLGDRGVLGLGFGTEVHRAGIPDDLVAACAARGMPLFEVPYRTPFIAVARAHSEAIAAQAYARRTWAYDTQRAIALAALRPQGLTAVLAELGRRLDAWTGMFDAAGALSIVHARGGLEPAVLDALAERVADVLARGLEAGLSLTIDKHAFTLFTIGRGGQLRGVIALAIEALDVEARSVVTSVIAMAGLALEQNEQLAHSRRRLHAQLLDSLLGDDPTLASRVLDGLPPEPFVIGVAAQAPALADWWERHHTDPHSRVFVAASDLGVTICLAASDTPVLDELAARFGIRIGVSDPATYLGFSHAHAQAVSALRQPGAAEAVRFVDATTTSILTALATDEARLVAETRLAPLRENDQRTGSELERSLRCWLAHDTRAASAAAELGVHRHTLRSRISQAGALLGVDLSSFPARAEVWALLQTCHRDDTRLLRPMAQEVRS